MLLLAILTTQRVEMCTQIWNIPKVFSLEILYISLIQLSQ